MNYKNHYDKLITRAQTRKLSTYVESHHIIPRCVGGKNTANNKVNLTPEEHYVAHQLLVKIYPNNYKLIYAANMMCVNSKNLNRLYNKSFGWLRRKLSETQKINQSGNKNSRFKTCWIYNSELKKSKSIQISELEYYLDNNWEKGRIINFDENIIKKCVICNKILPCIVKRKTCNNECYSILKIELNKNRSCLFNREEEFLKIYNEYLNVDKTLKIMGFPGNQASWGKRAREILIKAGLL